jgi:tRNA threonylcarbamoyladenosine biosynthesis protein TsaE
MKVFDTKSADETFSFAQKIGETCKSGTVIGLTGDLGTGKTVFAKGFAAGLGIKRGVNSPTYTIVHQYDDGRLPFYHFDVYRIGDVTEMEETGFDDCVLGEGVTLVEWADIIREIMPAGTIWINIAKDPAKGFDYRRIMVEDEYTGD